MSNMQNHLHFLFEQVTYLTFFRRGPHLVKCVAAFALVRSGFKTCVNINLRHAALYGCLAVGRSPTWPDESRN